MSTKNKKNDDMQLQRRQRIAQILFALLALMVILSMILTAVVTY